MFRIFKIIVLIVLLGAAGFFLYREIAKPEQTDDVEAMKQSLIAPAVVRDGSLSAELKDKYQAELKKAQDQTASFNFDNLQSINSIAQYKKLLGDIDGAIVAWEYANRIRPQNSLSFSNLAALYHFDLKQYDLAEKNYLISIGNDPDDMNTIRNLFEMYFYALKDNGKAEALLLQAIEENKENPTVLVDLYGLSGSFYVDTGNNQKALQYYRKALGLNPQNEAVRQEVARLETLQ